MAKLEKNSQEIEKIKDIIKEGKIDEAVKKISAYLNSATEENNNEYLENVIETVSTVHDGKIVIRLLIEHKIIDIPALLQNISKKDSVSRYSFLYLLKNICENEGDLILPYKEELLDKDPNIKEEFLQLLLFVAGGEKKINDELLIKMIASNLKDEKEFVVEKASQVLKEIGKSSPSIINKVLTDFVKESTEIETIKNRIHDILKSIVNIEKINEKKEEPTLENKKVIIEKEKKEGEEIKIEPKGEEKVIIKEIKPEEKEKPSEEKAPTTPKYLEKAAEKIIDKEIELKKKDLEIKKKTLEIEEKEKQFEEETIKEREKTLKMKQELLEKEKELSKVELQLKKKEIDEKEKELLKKGSKLKEKK